MLLIKEVFLLCFTLAPCYSVVHYINWSLATDRGYSHKEREYSHPAYREIALSPCDLTEDSCDVNCCSDQDCATEQTAEFNCIDGLEGGEKKQLLRRYDCEHIWESPHESWLQILCFVISNTPYLGEYFFTQKKIETLTKFIDSTSYRKAIFNYKDNKIKQINDSDEHYRFSSPLKMMFKDENARTNRPIYLKMPSNTFLSGGICNDDVPIKFLKNHESTCLRTISKANCENRPDFSVLKYLVGDSSSNDSVINEDLYYVARDGKLQNSTYSELKFLCYRNGSDYITFSRSVFRSNASKMLFSSDLDSEGEEDPFLFECLNSQEELLTPSYDEKEEVCRNVLISVVFDFTWNGTDLTNLMATYIIADIPVTISAFIKFKLGLEDLNSDSLNSFISDSDNREVPTKNISLYVTQQFVSTFRHSKRDVTLINNDTLEEEETVSYSGNPGYEVGSPVIPLQSNGTSLVWEGVNFAVWENAVGCKKMKPVEFGYDIVTSCRLEIDIEDLEDCDSIREKILNHQQLLVTADVVSQGGVILINGSEITTFGELVPILRIPLINVSDSDEGKCAGIPARHVVDILYTTVPDPGPEGHPIHRICGVRVRLDVVDWAPDINASRQIFLLESAITFTPVSIVDRNSVSRFWEAVRSPEGSENAWLNFFQVLDQFETGDEVAEMSTYVIGIMFVAVTFTILTRQHFPL